MKEKNKTLQDLMMVIDSVTAQIERDPSMLITWNGTNRDYSLERQYLDLRFSAILGYLNGTSGVRYDNSAMGEELAFRRILMFKELQETLRNYHHITLMEMGSEMKGHKNE